MVRDWSSSYKNSPADIDNLAQGAAEIRSTREAVEERATVEHVWGGGSGSTEGAHRQGSGRCYYSTVIGTPPTELGDNTQQSGRLRVVNAGAAARRLQFCATDTGSWDINRWLNFDECQDWKVSGNLTVAGTSSFTGAISAVAATFTGAVVINGGSLKVGAGGTVITELVIS